MTASVNGDPLREIYFPPHQRGMAHFSSPSPDRHWILVVEMNRYGAGRPAAWCRSRAPSAPNPLGQMQACTAAGWSPDGSGCTSSPICKAIATFGGNVFQTDHPSKSPSVQPMTEGRPSSPQEIRSSPSCRLGQTDIWIHDPPDTVLSHPKAKSWPTIPPVFSQDDTVSVLPHATRTRGIGPRNYAAPTWNPAKPTRFRGISMLGFDVLPDGKRVVYLTSGPRRTNAVVAGPRRSQLASPSSRHTSAAFPPHFGPNGQIVFQRTEGNANDLEQIMPDGSGLSKVVPYSIVEIQGISPGRRWLMAVVPAPPGVDGPRSWRSRWWGPGGALR